MNKKEQIIKENETPDDEIYQYDDDDSIGTDLVIEVDPEELEDILSPQEEKPVETPEIIQETNLEDENFLMSKHTIEDRHRLKWDIIFRGKKDTQENVDELEDWSSNENIELDRTSSYWYESQDNENYLREKKVKEKVFSVLSQKTELNFTSNRRKPSKSDFNNYYYLLKTSLDNEGFTNIELFNELSVYFSDNLFNMFKLLDNKWRNLIIKELEVHVGKVKTSTEIRWSNIFQGTEIEFKWIDESDNPILITGSVISKNESQDILRVDSYEKIYTIHLCDVSKILNNKKFKTNLNKLNNIDFL